MELPESTVMKKCGYELETLQLRQPVCDGILSGHPWVFRDKVGSSARNFKDGQWLRLSDPNGRIIATGIYQSQGGVAVRVLRMGPERVTLGWLKSRLEEAIALRRALSESTEAYRLLNGESDGFPGIVFDVYRGVGVLQTYFSGADSLGRYLAAVLRSRLGLRSVIWKAPVKRVGDKGAANRVLFGARPYVVRFSEGPLELAADLWEGQKSGTYLDLRGLRRYLSGLQLRGKRVLNLFSYTGALGLACAQAGASEVVNVDEARASLDFGKRYHKHQAMQWVQADIFKWISIAPKQGYDLIIVDPPSMAANKSQVLKALRSYHHLYTTLLPMLRPGGVIVACCCTSRISKREMEEKVSFALRPLSRIQSLPMEIDHRAGFREADYLKVMVFKQQVIPGKESSRVAYRAASRATKSDRGGRLRGRR